MAARKAPEAFRTISEVAEWLGVNAHVLRFWESKFPQIKPVKRAGGRRYYRTADMELIGGIKQLLHEDGLTIKGAQKVLREQGVKAVSALSPPVDQAPLEGAPGVGQPPEEAPLEDALPLGHPQEATPLEDTLPLGHPPEAAQSGNQQMIPPGPDQEPDPEPEPDPNLEPEPDVASAPDSEPQPDPAAAPTEHAPAVVEEAPMMVDVPPDTADNVTTVAPTPRPEREAGGPQVAPLPGPGLSVQEALERLVPGNVPVGDLAPLLERAHALRSRMAQGEHP